MGYNIAAAGCVEIAPFNYTHHARSGKWEIVGITCQKGKKGSGAVQGDEEDVEGSLRRFEHFECCESGDMAFGEVAGLHTALTELDIREDRTEA